MKLEYRDRLMEYAADGSSNDAECTRADCLVSIFQVCLPADCDDVVWKGVAER